MIIRSDPGRIPRVLPPQSLRTGPPGDRRDRDRTLPYRVNGFFSLIQKAPDGTGGRGNPPAGGAGREPRLPQVPAGAEDEPGPMESPKEKETGHCALNPVCLAVSVIDGSMA